MGFLSHWQKNFSEKREELKALFSEREIRIIEEFLHDAEGKEEFLPCYTEEICRDIEFFSAGEISIFRRQEDFLCKEIFSSPISEEEIPPSSFSFSDEEEEGRERLRLSREILLNPARILEILIPAIDNAILSLEEEEPEKARAIRNYAKRIADSCVS